MALSSMTGFARGHGGAGNYTWAWELKSVNSKGLDLKLRLPPGWDAIEPGVRARANEVLLFDHESNVAGTLTALKGDADAAFARAPYVRRERFKVQRFTAVPIEARGLLAQWDAAAGKLTVFGAAKIAFPNRRMLAQMMEPATFVRYPSGLATTGQKLAVNYMIDGASKLALLQQKLSTTLVFMSNLIQS